MTYSGITFLFFLLPLTLLVYNLVPFRWRNPVLFGASMVFFAWATPFLPLLFLLGVLFNYLIGLLMERLAAENSRKIILTVGIAVDLLPTLAHPLLSAAMPRYLTAVAALYSLHSISYLSEIYRRETRAQTAFSALGVYLTMFPHALAGPVMRYDDLRPLLTRRSADIDRTAEGVWRFAVGLGKKVLLADRLFALWEQTVALSSPGAAAVWLGIGSFALAFWMGFSGYCDMAIGLGSMFGFDLPENFSRPFSALSLREFSHRWNATLSAWLRDYFLQPFFGHKPRLPITAIILSSVLAGFFYGGCPNMLLWGLFSGLLLAGERRIWGRLAEKLPRFLQRFITLLLVLLTFVFPASESVAAVVRNFAALFGLNGHGLGQALYLLASYCPIILFCIFCATRWPQVLWTKFIDSRPSVKKWVRPAAVLLLLIGCTAYMI